MSKETIARQKSSGEEGKFGALVHDPPTDESLPEPYDESGPQVYDFPYSMLGAATHAIEVANRRAERAGIEDKFTYEATPYEKQSTGKDGIVRVEQRVTLVLDRPVLRHDDWEFIGKISWDDEAGAIVHTADNARLRERPDRQKCDICHSDRRRSDTFVIERDGEQLQVGGDCVKRFFGIRPAGLWMLDWDLDDLVHDPDVEPGERRFSDRTETTQTMAAAVAAVKEFGWVSKANAPLIGQPPTADVVHDLLYPRRGYNVFTDRAKQRQLDQVRKTFLEQSEDAAEIIDFITNDDNKEDSEYFENLRAVVGSASVSQKNLGLFVSAVALVERKHRAETERAAKASSQHIGIKKEKVADIPVTITSVRHMSNDYGPTTLVEMADENGNVIKWFATGSKDFSPGQSFKLAATVKDHVVYNGVNETSVTRAKLT